MKVYLLRHGEALSKEEDPDRHLSERGIDQVRSLGERVKKKGIVFKEVYHSSKSRAEQTSELFLAQIGLNSKLKSCDDLKPNGDPSIWGEDLNSRSEDILLVGHLPYLENLCGYLVGHDKKVQFGEANLVCLERTGDRNWKFLWREVP